MPALAARLASMSRGFGDSCDETGKSLLEASPATGVTGSATSAPSPSATVVTSW